MSKIVSLIFVILLISGQSFAQAFDPNCYFPRIGIEIDTLTGPPFFGYDLLKLENDRQTGDEEFVCWNGDFAKQHVVLSSGKVTNIHNLKVKKVWNIDLSEAIFANFRSTQHKDAFVAPWYIYWADENGDFDSSRYTNLWSTIQGNYGAETGGGFYSEPRDAWAVNLTDDSLADVIVLGLTRWSTLQEYRDSARYYILFFDGNKLYRPKGERAYNDSALEYAKYDTISYVRRGTPGNFRGTGREDLLTTDSYGNFFFYRNELPFSLENFRNGILYDTLLARWQDTHLLPNQGTAFRSHKSMKAFPKPSWDQSDDFVAPFATDGYRSQSYLFFRGGPEFGSKRLTLDSAEFVLRSPALLDGSFSGMSFNLGSECGDMTGTGNPVLMSGGAIGHGIGHEFYYVLGKAIDERADIYLSSSGSSGIKITADADNLQDVLFQVNNYKGPSLDPVSGSLAVLRGSKEIPVTLNPKYAVDERKALSASTNNLLATPNPFVQKTVLTFDNCSDGVMYMEVVNTLGKVMLREEIVDVDGLQQYSADLGMLVPGAYHIRLVCPADGWSATATVVKM